MRKLIQKWRLRCELEFIISRIQCGKTPDVMPTLQSIPKIRFKQLYISLDAVFENLT